MTLMNYLRDGVSKRPLQDVADLRFLHEEPLPEEVLFSVTKRRVRISTGADGKPVDDYVVAIQPRKGEIDGQFLYCALHVFSDRILRAWKKKGNSLLDEVSTFEVPLLSLNEQIEIAQTITRVLTGPRSVFEIIEATVDLSSWQVNVEGGDTDGFLAAIREERPFRLIKAKEDELRRTLLWRIRTSSVGYEPIHVLIDLLLELYFYDKESPAADNVTVMEQVFQDYFVSFESMVDDYTSGQKLSRKEKKYLDWISNSKAALTSCGLASQVLSMQVAVWKNYIEEELLSPPSKRRTISVVWGALGSQIDTFNSWMLTEGLRNEGTGYVRKKMIIDQVDEMIKVREDWRSAMSADLPHGWLWVKLDEISEEDIEEKPELQLHTQLEFGSAHRQHEGEYLLVAKKDAGGPFRRRPLAHVARGRFIADDTFQILRIRTGVSLDYISAYLNVVNIYGYSGELSILLPPKDLQDKAEEALASHFEEDSNSPTCVPIDKIHVGGWERQVIKETFKRLAGVR